MSKTTTIKRTGQPMHEYGEQVHALHFDEDGCGPLPMFAPQRATVQVIRWEPREASPYWSPARIHLRTRPYGGWQLTADDARRIAQELLRAADDADALDAADAEELARGAS